MHLTLVPQGAKRLAPHQPQDKSLRDPIFVSTLPFDQHEARRYVTEAVLERTKKKWFWFVEAQRIEPALGTLCYLPPEIRRQIWATVLHCRETLSVEGLWEYDNLKGPVFSLSAYFFGFGRRGLPGNTANRLRLVSKFVKAEYEDAFLSLRTFRFNRPQDLDTFLESFTGNQRSRLRSIAIGLSVCTLESIRIWTSSLTRLPSTLQDVQFRIYRTFNAWFVPMPRDTWNALHGLYYLNREVQQEDFDLIETLVKCAVRSAPDARVSISPAGQDVLSPLSQAAVDAIIRNARKQKPAAYLASTSS